MCTAIQAIKDRSSVSSQAACVHMHGVPYTTLYDRMIGNMCHRTNLSLSLLCFLVFLPITSTHYSYFIPVPSPIIPAIFFKFLLCQLQ